MPPAIRETVLSVALLAIGVGLAVAVALFSVGLIELWFELFRPQDTKGHRGAWTVFVGLAFVALAYVSAYAYQALK